MLGFIREHDPYATFSDIESPMTYLNNIISFIKPIASKDELEAYIDEAEWRIKATIEKPHNKYFKLLNPINHEKPFGKLVFPIDEIKIIILPDKGTRQLLYQSQTFKSVFETMEDSPIIMSFEELQEL